MGFKFLGVFYESLKRLSFYKCSNCKKKKPEHYDCFPIFNCNVHTS